MTEAPTRAVLTPKTNAQGARTDGTPVTVHFNPESLALTIRNTMEDSSGDNSDTPAKLISSSEVTLAVQLVFDTTLDGADVRTVTANIAEMMRPGAVVPNEDDKSRPMVVEFAWNEFAFEGIITDYSETLDYFSAEGIPLRSNLNLTLTKHEAGAPAAGTGSADTGAGSSPPTAPVASGDTVEDSVARSGSGSAAQAPGGGASHTAKDVAAANGVENLKDPQMGELASPDAAFSAGAAAGAMGSPLSAGAGAGFGAGARAGAGISFGAPPAAFASGDAGFGLDLGASAGAGAGLSVGAGASAGASLGGAPSVSAAAGAGGALELDAFAGLSAPKVGASASLGGGKVSFELPEAPGLSGGVGLSAGVSMGGSAGLSAGTGISAGAGVGAMIGGGQTASVGREINLADIIFKEET